MKVGVRVVHLLFPLVLPLSGCGSRAAPPSADVAQRPFPDLNGRAVMVLPVQAGVPTLSLPIEADSSVAPAEVGEAAVAQLEAELAFWLAERGTRVRWVMPEQIVKAADRSRMLGVRPRALAIRDFQRAKLESIGDPLYGELRSLSMLADARIALLPLGAAWVTEQDGSGRVHVAAALIDTFGGSVLWQGAVAGSAGRRGEPGTLASAAQALAELVRP